MSILSSVAASLHVIEFPSGRFGYVGQVPTALCEELPATRAAILGCRTHTGPDGEPHEWKAPNFDTAQAALDFARARGFSPVTLSKGVS